MKEFDPGLAMLLGFILLLIAIVRWNPFAPRDKRKWKDPYEPRDRDQ